MSDKDFKVKNKLVVNGLTGGAGPLIANSNKEIDSVAFISTAQGGTGITTAPSAGQVLYSAGGTTYNPTTLNTLDVKGATYSADAPSSPAVGQIWVESDANSDAFDPNIMRRKSFTATASQTVFTTDYVFIDGYEQVYFNGMLLLLGSDYTTNGATNTVTLLSGAAAGDIVEVVSITNLNSINTATTTTNTFTGNQGVGGSPLFPIHQIGAVAPNVVSDTYLNTGGPAYLGRRARGTFASPSATQAGDGLNAFIARGYGSTGFGTNNVAAILLNAEENFTDTSQPTHIAFGTTASGSITRSERMRIDSSGRVGIGISSPTAPLHLSTNSATDVNPAFIGNFTGAGGTDFRLVRNSTANSQSVRTFRIRGGNDFDSFTSFELGMESNHALRFMTNNTERMRITADGLVDMGLLKSAGFSANTTLTDSTVRTYSANTWYNLGTFPMTTSETYFCQFVIQYTDVGYHTYIGCFIMPATYWKNAGSLWTQTFIAEQHNGNNATVTVRLNVSNGSRSIDFQTDQSIAVATGGFVKLKMKRMFYHD